MIPESGWCRVCLPLKALREVLPALGGSSPLSSHDLDLVSSSGRAPVRGLGPTLVTLSQPITPAKALLPHKVTFTGTRDKDSKTSFLGDTTPNRDCVSLLSLGGNIKDHTCPLQRHKDVFFQDQTPPPTPAPVASGQPCLSRGLQTRPSPSSLPLSTRRR